MTTLATTLIVTTAATTATNTTTTHQLRHSRDVVRFFDNHTWLRAPNQSNCMAVPWTGTCRIARRLYVHHAARIADFEAQYRIDNTDNWVRAMRYAQRPFPGTRSWLEFISNRECRACWTTPGGFVCNYEGSGACGPMQFMSGTFYDHAPDAKAWLEARNWIVNPAVWDWHNPLGQALTAAYMRFTDQDGCHWCL